MLKKLYKHLGFWWYSDLDIPNDLSVYGPYCPNCYSDLEFPHRVQRKYLNEIVMEIEYVGKIQCLNCDKSFRLKSSVSTLKHKVSLKLRSNARALLDKVSLDEPVTQVKVRDQDDKYFLAAKIGQKDGKRVGVVYFGEKSKDQNKEDYSQIFIDLDDEQIRFDKSNKHPKDILAKMKVEFPNTVVENKFGKDKGGEKI